jgi:hypothetical protein
VNPAKLLLNEHDWITHVVIGHEKQSIPQENRISTLRCAQMLARPIRRVKLILPALTEDGRVRIGVRLNIRCFRRSAWRRLAAYLDRDLERYRLQDEHVEKLNLDDDPDLVHHSGLHNTTPIARTPSRVNTARAGFMSCWADYM